MRHKDERHDIVADLNWVAQRLLRHAYKQAGDADEREHTALAAVIQDIVGPHEWQARPNLSLIDVMHRAITSLPEKMTRRTPGGIPEKTPVPPTCLDSPEQDIAATLYGFNDTYVASRIGADRQHFTYSDYISAAKELAKLQTNQDSTAKRMIRVVREDLADALLAMKPRVFEQRHQIHYLREGPKPIQRDAALNRVRKELHSPTIILCIWGEPGTGKTTLAEQAAQSLDDGPVTTLHAGDPDILRADIVDLLVSDGLEPTNWTDEYCRAMLRSLMDSEVPRTHSSVLILDNVEDEALIWQLVPEHPTTYILVTMREKPLSPNLTALELGDFSEEQACRFIRSYLPDCHDHDIRSLARVLGYRPLALDHAVRFIRDSPAVSVREVIETLAISVTDGLNLVTDERARRRNLVRLYEFILASVVQHDPASVVLDNFLALAGKSGMVNYNLLLFFMESEYGGNYHRIQFHSGLRTLFPRGLLRECLGTQAGARHTLLSMHQLTYEILRELRGNKPLRIEGEYIKLLKSSGLRDLLQHDPDERDTITNGTAMAFLMSTASAAMDQVLPPGWQHFGVVDKFTWLAIRTEVSEAGEDTYVLRYEVHDTGTYKVDYRTGKRVLTTAEELREFQYLCNLFARVTVSSFRQLDEDHDLQIEFPPTYLRSV